MLGGISCPRCGGHGWIHDSSQKHDKGHNKCFFCEDCKTCHGTKTCAVGDAVCPKCRGKGFQHTSSMKHEPTHSGHCFFCEDCSNCHGLGVVQGMVAMSAPVAVPVPMPMVAAPAPAMGISMNLPQMSVNVPVPAVNLKFGQSLLCVHHPHQLEYGTRGKKNGTFKCDVCKKGNQSNTQPRFYCKQCDWDMCASCAMPYLNQPAPMAVSMGVPQMSVSSGGMSVSTAMSVPVPQMSVSTGGMSVSSGGVSLNMAVPSIHINLGQHLLCKYHPHELEYGQRGLSLGTFKCDVCKVGGQPNSQPRFFCARCDWDMCANCATPYLNQPTPVAVSMGVPVPQPVVVASPPMVAVAAMAGPCPHCNGTGFAHDSNMTHDKPPNEKCFFCSDCKTCHATGMMRPGESMCMSCGGKGCQHTSSMKHEPNLTGRCFFCEDCPRCHGTGVILAPPTVSMVPTAVSVAVPQPVVTSAPVSTGVSLNMGGFGGGISLNMGGFGLGPAPAPQPAVVMMPQMQVQVAAQFPPFQPVKEGYAQKRGILFNQNYRKRYFALGANALTYFGEAAEYQKFKDDVVRWGIPEAIKTYAKGTILLSANTQLADDPSDPQNRGLIIKTPSRDYFLLFDSALLKEDWKKTIFNYLSAPVDPRTTITDNDVRAIEAHKGGGN